MNEQLNSGKGFLKDKLGGYQVDPPGKVWDSISAQMGGKSRRRMIIIALSVAATIILAVMLGINYFGPGVNEEAVVADAGTKEAGRETLEKKVATTLEELATQEELATREITGEEPARREITSKELAVHVDIEETAREFSTVGTATVGSSPGEQTEQPGHTGQAEPVANTFQPDEVAGTEPFADIADEVTGTEATADTPAGDNSGIDDTLVPDTGDELPADPIPDMDIGGKKDPRWIIGAALSPLYSFRDAEATAMKGSAEHESGIISYAGGVHVSYRTASRLAIETGVFFNKMGISIDAPGIQIFNESLDFAPLGGEVNRSNVMAISNSVGNIVSKSGDIYVNTNASYEAYAVANNISTEEYADQGIQQHLDYLELPFNLRYTVIDRNIELQLVGGISTNFLVNNYVTMETSDGSAEIGYLTNIKSVNYSGNAGVGLIYHIQDQFSLRLEPRFRYFLNSVNDGTLPATRPYTFGLFTGLSYTF